MEGRLRKGEGIRMSLHEEGMVLGPGKCCSSQWSSLGRHGGSRHSVAHDLMFGFVYRS